MIVWKKEIWMLGKAKKMVYDRDEWLGFGKENAWGVAHWKPLLTRCNSCGLSQLYESLGGESLSLANPTT